LLLSTKTARISPILKTIKINIYQLMVSRRFCRCGTRHPTDGRKYKLVYLKINA